MIRYQINTAGDIFDTLGQQDIGSYHKGRLSVDFFKVENFDALGLDIDEWLQTNGIAPRTKPDKPQYMWSHDLIPILTIIKGSNETDHKIARLLTILSGNSKKFEATFSSESFDELYSAINQKYDIIIPVFRLLKVNCAEVYEALTCETKFEGSSMSLTFWHEGKPVHRFHAMPDAIDRFLSDCRGLQVVRAGLEKELGIK